MKFKTRAIFSKPSKRRAATILDPQKRGEFKRLMLIAENTQMPVSRKGGKGKEDNELE